MNLIEAIKSGRPFRRKSRDGIDYRWTLGKDVNCAQVKPDQIIFNVEDVLADDWEIEEPKVEITRAQFWEAVKASQPLRAYFEQRGGLVGREMQSFGKTDLGDYVQATELAKRLGLGLSETETP